MGAKDDPVRFTQPSIVTAVVASSEVESGTETWPSMPSNAAAVSTELRTAPGRPNVTPVL